MTLRVDFINKLARLLKKSKHAPDDAGYCFRPWVDENGKEHDVLCAPPRTGKSVIMIPPHLLEMLSKKKSKKRLR